MAVQIEFLKSISYFSGLSPAELDSVGQYLFEKIADRGELVLVEGEPGEVLYFVVSGLLKIFKTSAEGREQVLNISRPGESFNDIIVFDGGPNPASAQAISPVVLYGVKRDNLEAILRRYPQVALNANRVLASQVRHLASLVEDLSFRHVTERVAKILLEHIGDGNGQNPRLTQQEMAAMAGTAREVVGRSLRDLEEEGLIRLDRHRIVITDKKSLEEMVEASA